MSLKKYIEETARKLEAPITGDEFDFHINESLSIECEVVEHSDNSYVIAVDQLAYDMLKEADAIDESKMCEQCHMGSMYSTSEGKMQCDECGYSMTTESATRALQRARDSGIDVERNGIGDGYYIGRDVHDYGDNVKVAYNLYYLEDPAGLENELAPAFREVGGLDVSPYRPKPEEVKAAAVRLKIKDQVNSKLTNNESISEAEYQGRQVKLGKPMAGDTAKYKVYVRDPKTGNIKKVNFGDKNMSIKRDNPARRKNFRARHNCASKKDRTTAGYWSCRMWSKKPVSKILRGK